MSENTIASTLLLRSAGFAYLPDEAIWVSRTYRQAYSDNALADHNSAWLKGRLSDRVPPGQFWFYFKFFGLNCREDCSKILAHLRLGILRPEIRCGTLRAEEHGLK